MAYTVSNPATCTSGEKSAGKTQTKVEKPRATVAPDKPHTPRARNRLREGRPAVTSGTACTQGAHPPRGAGADGGGEPRAAGGLYTRRGARKYLTRDERQRLLARCGSQSTDAELLVLTLLWTGARVSEVLALTPSSFQLDAGLVALRTLKRRRPVVREVPVPPAIMAALDARFGLRAAQAAGEAHRLWPCSRVTAWRQVKARLAAVGVHGSHACPKGLRHGFGVATVQSGTPITLTQRWMGHKKLETTAIYTDVMGPEERGFANAFFTWSGVRAA